MSRWMEKVLSGGARSPDVVLAVVMALVMAAMIIPMPSWLLDGMLALNLAVSVTLLVAALLAKDALQVASFPTLLLLTTLFRLALNVSSTRLALSEGHAGEVIEAFGEFVIRGDYIVGTVVFAILTLVQFLVVAKGAERVAEVSARFTLDAMPGKQMSIDADLRSGAIDQAQARERRRELERESQMFGAMDGAMKFVKGDVIAGLVIVAINLLGGTALGVLQQRMPVGEAAATYALIAIGDGLVSQLPSLLITVAAGLVVTRVAGAAEAASLGRDIGLQFFGQYRALWVTAGVCAAVACIPGMPKMAFVLIAVGLAALGAFLHSRRPEGGTKTKTDFKTTQAAPSVEAEKASAMAMTPLRLDLAADLTPLLEPHPSGALTAALAATRDLLYAELGVRAPALQVRKNVAHLPAGHYEILVDEVPCARGVLSQDVLYAPVSPEEIAFLGVQPKVSTDPRNGKVVSTVPVMDEQCLRRAKVTVFSAASWLAEHVAHVIRRRAASFLGVQDAQVLLDGLEAQAPALVRETLAKIPLVLLTEVLRRLLAEQVSIRNLRVILEALVAPQAEGDAAALTERCREALAPYLSHRYAPSGPLFAYLVDPQVEDALREGSVGLDPLRAADILESVGRTAAAGTGAVVLASADVRRKLRRLCEGAYPDVAVLTYAELQSDIQVRPLGKIAPSHAWS
jgi:type III secretion protein V